MNNCEIESALEEKIQKIRDTFKSIRVMVELVNTDDTYFLRYSAPWENELWEEHFGRFSAFAFRNAKLHFPTAIVENELIKGEEISSTIRIGNLFDFLAQ